MSQKWHLGFCHELWCKFHPGFPFKSDKQAAMQYGWSQFEWESWKCSHHQFKQMIELSALHSFGANIKTQNVHNSTNEMMPAINCVDQNSVSAPRIAFCCLHVCATIQWKLAVCPKSHFAAGLVAAMWTVTWAMSTSSANPSAQKNVLFQFIPDADGMFLSDVDDDICVVNVSIICSDYW